MASRSRIGVVLAGGLGRRFGGEKAFYPLEGATLAERAAATLAVCCPRVVVSLRPGAANPAPGYGAVFDDPPAGRGPLAGLVAAAALDAGADLLVLACDYPGVRPPLLRRLLGRAACGAADVTLAVGRDGREHPLVAVWSPPALAAARDALATDRLRVAALLERLALRRVCATPAESAAGALRNVNRREALETDDRA